MKVSLRLIKGAQSRSGKKAVAREQRFRFGAEPAWEVSCRPAKRRAGADLQIGPRKAS